jgi:hypothetical protein
MPEFVRVTVIVMSGFVSDDRCERLIAVGSDGSLSKPIGRLGVEGAPGWFLAQGARGRAVKTA